MGIHSATGWLEEKLRNVRRCPSEQKKSKRKAPRNSKLVKIGVLPGYKFILVAKYI